VPIATARKDWDMSNFGVSSSVANLKRVAVRPPTRDADYQAAHWLGAPEQLDLDALQADHAAFVELLRELGCEVDVLPEAPGQADACFVYDPAFTTPTGVIQLQGAKEARVKEPAMLAGDINALGMPTVGVLIGDATADGGDMFWLDNKTVAIGRTYRTNEAGEKQLREIFAAEGIEALSFHMPHAMGPKYCLHLMSVISPIRDDLAVVYEREAPVTLLQELAKRGIKTISVPDEEYMSLACNVLAIRPGVVVMPSGNPITAQLLRDAGIEVHIYKADVINRGEGGPTCLTRPLWRED
jgi:N-dimethylarginine dimethylaminohydrolase